MKLSEMMEGQIEQGKFFDATGEETAAAITARLHECVKPLEWVKTRCDKGRERHQSFTAFRGGSQCDGFIDSAPDTHRHRGGFTGGV